MGLGEIGRTEVVRFAGFSCLGCRARFAVAAEGEPGEVKQTVSDSTS